MKLCVGVLFIWRTLRAEVFYVKHSVKLKFLKTLEKYPSILVCPFMKLELSMWGHHFGKISLHSTWKSLRESTEKNGRSWRARAISGIVSGKTWSTRDTWMSIRSRLAPYTSRSWRPYWPLYSVRSSLPIWSRITGRSWWAWCPFWSWFSSPSWSILTRWAWWTNNAGRSWQTCITSRSWLPWLSDTANKSWLPYWPNGTGRTWGSIRSWRSRRTGWTFDTWRVLWRASYWRIGDCIVFSRWPRKAWLWKTMIDAFSLILNWQMFCRERKNTHVRAGREDREVPLALEGILVSVVHTCSMVAAPKNHDVFVEICC